MEDGSIVYLPGIHKPIIDEEIFKRVQNLIARSGKVVNKFNDIAYLKGALNCPKCGKLLTSCKSKGKIKHYWYYECAVHRKSYNVDVANEKFDQILDELSFEDYQIEYLKNKIGLLLQEKFKSESGDVVILNKRKASVLSKKSKLEEKYLDDKIDDEMYSKWHKQLKQELSDIKIKINSLEEIKSNYEYYFTNSMSYLNSVKKVFHLATTSEKLNFVEIVFGKELIYDGDIYRTPFINPIFVSKTLILKGKRLLDYTKKSEDFNKSSSSDHDEFSTEHFEKLFSWIDAINKSA